MSDEIKAGDRVEYVGSSLSLTGEIFKVKRVDSDGCVWVVNKGGFDQCFLPSSIKPYSGDGQYVPKKDHRACRDKTDADQQAHPISEELRQSIVIVAAEISASFIAKLNELNKTNDE